jgi:glycosyltransferase involved in cell wall biosynthesis
MQRMEAGWGRSGMTRQVDRVSIVIPALNEGANLVDTVRCVLENTAYPDFEVLVVDDGSTDGSGDRLSNVFGNDRRVGMVRAEGIGAANARNLGATCASGKILIFLDAHCYTPPDWMDGLIQPLADTRVGMVGSAIAIMRHGGDVRALGLTWRDASLEVDWLGQRENTPYPVPLLGAACQAVRKADLERLGYYDNGMTRYGSEDLELCLRYWLMGYEVLVQPQTVIYHLFRESHPYEIQAQEMIYNRLRLAMLHLSNERVDRVLNYHRNMPGFNEIMGGLRRSDVMSRRSQLQELRCRDDDWFCTRFDCRI